MNYMLMICSDGVATDEKSDAMRAEMPRWLEDTGSRGIRRLGQQLEGPDAAVTVRVRDGETLVSDGPFAESKEFLAGFDLIECENLDDAIEVAASHPASRFHGVEVRPFYQPAGSEQAPAEQNGAVHVPTGEELGAPEEGRQRYMLLMCIDGIPEGDEVEAGIHRENEAWLRDATARGVQRFGYALEHADNATTVRVRDGQTLISDGPFVESKEFIGGFDIVECASREEAIELAAAHPLARFHMVEVRPFAQA